MLRSLIAWLPWLLLAGQSLADDTPHASHLDRNALPPGARRKVALYGTNLRNALVVHDDLRQVRVQVVPGPRKDPNRLALEVEAPAGVPLGYYGFRVVSGQGISNPMILLVDDLPTVRESGTHDRLATAQRLTWPAAVEGNATKDQADFFRIHANRGDWLSVEALAQRIGSPLDPLIVLLDEQGRELAGCDDDPALNPDARFAHRFAESGDYVLEIRDSSYRGGDNYRYRLRVGNFPLVTACYPLAGHAGKQVQVELVGPAVDRVPRQNLTMPPRAAGDEVVQFSATGSQGGGSAFFRMFKSDTDEWLEAEPNDLPDQPQHVDLETAINGRIDRPHDRDQYVFSARAGEHFELHCMTRTLGSPAELLLRLYDSLDKQIAQGSDDIDGERTLRCQLPRDGRYRLLVEDAASHGGPDYVYRIELDRRSRTFIASAEAAVFAIPQDCVLAIPVKVQRDFGFKGPIQFGLAGTVSGWNVLDSIPASKSSGEIRIELPGDIWSGFANGFYLSVFAKVDGGTSAWQVSHRAAVQKELNGLPAVPENLLGAMNVAILPKLPPAYELQVERPMLKIEPLGKTASLTVRARRMGTFNGPIELRVRGLPEECEVHNTIIDRGQDSAVVTVKLVEDTVGDSSRFEVLGLGKHEGQWRKVIVPNLRLEVVRPD